MDTNFSNFGRQELLTASKLLELYANDALTPVANNYFNDLQSVQFNSQSGCVYLIDEDYQCLVYNDDLKMLDLWLVTPYNGEEGFLDDLVELVDTLHPEDLRYLLDFSDYLAESQVLALVEALES